MSSSTSPTFFTAIQVENLDFSARGRPILMLVNISYLQTPQTRARENKVLKFPVDASSKNRLHFFFIFFVDLRKEIFTKKVFSFPRSSFFFMRNGNRAWPKKEANLTL